MWILWLCHLKTTNYLRDTSRTELKHTRSFPRFRSAKVNFFTESVSPGHNKQNKQKYWTQLVLKHQCQTLTKVTTGQLLSYSTERKKLQIKKEPYDQIFMNILFIVLIFFDWTLFCMCAIWIHLLYGIKQGLFSIQCWSKTRLGSCFGCTACLSMERSGVIISLYLCCCCTVWLWSTAWLVLCCSVYSLEERAETQSFPGALSSIWHLKHQIVDLSGFKSVSTETRLGVNSPEV